MEGLEGARHERKIFRGVDSGVFGFLEKDEMRRGGEKFNKDVVAFLIVT
jgi:hypothetical protein